MVFEELKQRQSVVWGAAPLERIVSEAANIHDHLLEELHQAFVDFYEARKKDGRVEAPREYVIILGARR